MKSRTLWRRWRSSMPALNARCSGVRLGMPVTIEVFVREIVAALFFYQLQSLLHEGIGLRVDRIGGEQAVGKCQRSINTLGTALAFVGGHIEMAQQQVAQRHVRRPAGLRVVADVEDAADF